MFVLGVAGITISYSQGWTEDRLPLSDFTQKIEFTCKKQGPLGNKTVLVEVEYRGKSEISEISAKDQTDPKNYLVAKPIRQPYIKLIEINSIDPKKRAGRIENTGPSQGSMICTKNNYPIFLLGNQAWFIYEKKNN